VRSVFIRVDTAQLECLLYVVIHPKRQVLMANQQFSVVDCDGHIVESIPELAEYMDDFAKRTAIRPGRNRTGVFPALDAIHYPQPPPLEAETGERVARDRVTASEHRPGSGEDWAVFVQEANIDEAVLFTSEGLSVGFIQVPEYAVSLCRAYNDYVYNRFSKLSSRLHPMALIPMQDPQAAVLELRRVVTELGMPGAMLPSLGLPLNLGHQFYWPVYEEAERLDCVLGIHGGSNKGCGLDTFTDPGASRILHHPLPLMISFVSFFWQGVWDTFPNLRMGFLEGGCGWLAAVLDRMEREAHYRLRANRIKTREYLESGKILIGCEGGEETLGYLVKRVGPRPFAMATDYPHEVDMVSAIEEIQDLSNYPGLSIDERAAILGNNARQFFKL